MPKGLGLVEAALHAGIEIPVFCYEPRLGPPVGACRMCLVEVEGMPKLQAGCTMTATDGMKIRTAQTSPKAADGQDATLEFILVNHPLDCPVCDKGGECPLQDLTFRWGPGNTRMEFDKRTLEKPIPVSPTIALDRERCILCYRCTRFSESVAEDNQLVAQNRGASVGDRHLRGPAVPRAVLRQRDRALPGRGADLDAVPLRGPALGDPERAHRLRSLPGRLQRLRDDARGQGQADALAEPSRGRRGLALRQGPLRVHPPLRGRPDRRPAPPPEQERSGGDLVGRRDRRRGAAAARVRRADRDRALRLRDGRAGLRARAAAALRARCPLRRHAGGDEPGARRVPAAAVGDSRRRARGRARRRAGRRARAGGRPLGQGGPARGRRGALRRRRARKLPPPGEPRRRARRPTPRE